LNASSPQVLCKEHVLRPRNRFTVGEDGWSSCRLKLGGEVAVEARFRAEGNSLKASIRLNDSDVTKPILTDCLGIWAGSGVQLFAAADNKSKITSVFLTPDPDGSPRLLEKNGETGATGTISQDIQPAHYVLEAEIPFETLNLQPGSNSILIDLRCFLSALGDAHSGGKTTLSGSLSRILRPLFWELVVDG